MVKAQWDDGILSDVNPSRPQPLGGLIQTISW
eukprot:SAG31_NODE_5512_length_2486_cov_2.519481_1_plen_31_part_10